MYFKVLQGANLKQIFEPLTVVILWITVGCLDHLAKELAKMGAPIIDGMTVPPHKRRGAKPYYPWLRLKPGQAFKFNEGVSVSNAKSMAAQIAHGLAAKFAVRETEDGVFCWRVDGTKFDVPNGNYREHVPVIEDYADNPKTAKESAVVGFEPSEAPARPMPKATPNHGIEDDAI